ncbi:hypothetical protein F5X98DRAFT_386756 [Xylaria grammica]|nr:hypothetical protein F5X98DRAFT_386756 [Xylaria grammica]
MSQVAPACIIEKLAELGPKHLVVEGIMEAYIKKPTLVYMTFWECLWEIYFRNPGVHPGNRLDPTLYFDVENFEVAFAPFLATNSTRRMYQSIRTGVWDEDAVNRPDNVLAFHRYETVDGELKPIDYYFLENFHIVARCLDYQVIFSEVHGIYPLGRFQPGAELKWCPNLVVSLREVWEVTKDYDINELTPISDRIGSYRRFFGVLARPVVGLQDYLILVDRRGESKRVHDHFECGKCCKLTTYYSLLSRHTPLLLDATGPHCVTNHDVMDKLPTDLTAATLDDFDEEQYRWANCIAKCIKEWNATEGIRPLNSFFVRWKTEEELQAEDERLNRQLMGESPATVSCDRIGELHDSPTHLFLHDKYPAKSKNGL